MPMRARGRRHSGDCFEFASQSSIAEILGKRWLNPKTQSKRYTRFKSVRAQWREGTLTGTEVVAYPTMVKALQPLTLRLTNTGKVVGAPDTLTDAKSTAAGRAAVVRLGAVAFSALVARALRRC